MDISSFIMILFLGSHDNPSFFIMSLAALWSIIGGAIKGDVETMEYTPKCGIALVCGSGRTEVSVVGTCVFHLNIAWRFSIWTRVTHKQKGSIDGGSLCSCIGWMDLGLHNGLNTVYL